MSLIEKLKKNSTLKRTEILSESKFFGEKDLITTPVPMINVALSGKIDGGLGHGLTTIAGKSKHFKSGYLLLLIAAFQKKKPDGVVLFYDSEFGTPQSYFQNYGIDMSKVIHVPIMNVEELKFDIVNQLENIDDADDVFIGVDSIGNLASKKEVEDAINEKSVADMSRAKQLKSLFRIVTPYLTAKKIPMVVIGHTYDTMEMFSTSILSGGCVVEGTQIKTMNGLKSIEEIKVGDKVYTTNDLQDVTAVWNPNTLEEGEPECFEITFDDGYSFICSENHLLLTEDNIWIKASEMYDGLKIKSI